jgi:hypothetical protein
MPVDDTERKQRAMIVKCTFDVPDARRDADDMELGCSASLATQTASLYTQVCAACFVSSLLLLNTIAISRQYTAELRHATAMSVHRDTC